MKQARLIKREELAKEEEKEVMKPAAVVSPAKVSMTIEEVRKWIQERKTKPASDARSAFSALFAQS